MAEAFNSLYKWELIYPQGPWRGLDEVEFATLGYIDWFNHRRLHGEITDDNSYVTPAEFEATYYRHTSRRRGRLPNNPSSHGTRGGSESLRRTFDNPISPVHRTEGRRGLLVRGLRFPADCGSGHLEVVHGAIR